MTQQVKPTPEEFNEFVDKHYAHVMTPWQLDLLKRLYGHEGAITCTPYMHRRSQSLINEVIAIITAG